jgi:hypothetical protein
MVTAFATGTGDAGTVVARGCSEGTRLAGGVDTRVVVTLEQLPSDVDGDYDVLLELDIGQTIPPPYGPTIVLITDILSDPAGWVVYQVLREIDNELGTDFVWWTPPGSTTRREATFEEIRDNPSRFPTWEFARDELDQFLTAQLGQPYVTVTTVGGDIAHLIREFEVGAGYTLTSTGTANRVEVVEEWKALVFQWQLGCPQGDLGCARRAFELTGPNAHLAPAQAIYGATITHAPTASPAQTERFALALDSHQINVRYGAIILLALNQIVFPNLPGGIGGNSIAAVLGNIVQCPDVALALENATGLPAVIFEGICDTAVQSAATWLENQILALDSNNNPGLITGLSPNGGGELILVDRDHDLVTEQVERMTTYATWTTGQNVTTPIEGEGRRAAADCALDADCAPLVCVPIASYLKVRALEHDCRRAIGLMPGPSTCTADTDCASGICFDPGSGSRVCYTACDGSNGCSQGSCVAEAASVDLDSVLTGLGDAAVSACLP